MLNHASSSLPFKSVASGLLFAVILGPVGLLYASFWGGVTMIVVGFIVCSSRLFVPILLAWIISCIWSVHAVNRYNNKILEAIRVH
ncbi:MAG: hypothetical protein ACD_45C00697G0003 [uncultured bacterium]|nr:MAG: hypothetical protein ACD_45C00697G0003 [uncultured bacterium]OGT47815.1 MAG: hypothetical protein A3E83_03055 [Gammaproteobacteria bacterium RIFCSPHIGHO2_12_FULL_41_20]